MVFSSLSFIFLFLPLTCLAYFIIPKRQWRNGVLLAASLLFYAWGEPKFVLLLIGASLVAYIGGLIIARSSGAMRKTVFIVTTVLLAGNLFVFKYLNFTLDNICILFGTSSPVSRLVLPIGISFYTFQILSYVIDLYRGDVGVQKNYFLLLLYVALFPQLIAGPIVRYSTVESEITDRRETVEDAAKGVRRFAVGLGKKVLIANGCAACAELIYAGNTAIYGTAMYWIAALAYTLQIYFDFSGYSDMAIGLGRVFGFHFLENFDHPYISRSFTEFWRRWHISLSSWLRDYIYIPLGGSRVTPWRHIINLLIVWLLTGLWHGAEWNFVIWGLYWFVLLLIEKRLRIKAPAAIGWFITFFAALVGWVIFARGGNVTETFRMMFVPHRTEWFSAIAANAEVLWGMIWIPVGIVAMFPWRFPGDKQSAETVSYVASLLVLALCVIMLLNGSYNPFIYFRF